MALQSTGAISINNINVELGKAGTTANSSLNQTDFRTLAGIASGTISLASFYGKSAAPPATPTWTNITISGSSATIPTTRPITIRISYVYNGFQIYGPFSLSTQSINKTVASKHTNVSVSGSTMTVDPGANSINYIAAYSLDY